MFTAQVQRPEVIILTTSLTKLDMGLGQPLKWVKVFALKPEDLSSILTTNMVDGKKLLPQVVLWPLHVSWDRSTPPPPAYTQLTNKSINKKKTQHCVGLKQKTPWGLVGYQLSSTFSETLPHGNRVESGRGGHLTSFYGLWVCCCACTSYTRWQERVCMCNRPEENRHAIDTFHSKLIGVGSFCDIRFSATLFS